MSNKVALITGITGQDGSYLAEFLLDKGYEVHGIRRRTSSFNTSRIDHILQDSHEATTKLFLHYGDLNDEASLHRVIHACRPAEIYHLGAQSHVQISFLQPEHTADTVALSTVRLLEILKNMKSSNYQPKFYQAGSSEMFGSTPPPQDEGSPFYPRSPYGVSKVAAHWYATNYREAYDMFICNGILYNHESPRRGETFVTRKITRAVARIKLGMQKNLYLGNLEAKRDWGFAGDYVEAMWLMLQQDKPDDYVIATGETHSVRDFLNEAFSYLDLDWQKHVRIDENYYRPTEVDHLRGNYKKAKEKLGWEPKTSFRQLVRMMIDFDLEQAKKE